MRVPLGGPRVRPRRVDGDLGGVLVERVQQQRGVRQDRRVRRHGAGVLHPAGGRGDVDAVALDVLRERRRRRSSSASADDVVLGRADEGAAGLDGRAAGVVRWWLSTRPPTRLRASTSSTDGPRGATSRAATRPERPAPTTTTSTCAGQRALAGRRRPRGVVPGAERRRASPAAAGAAEQGAAGEAVVVIAAPVPEHEHVSDSGSYPTLRPCLLSRPAPIRAEAPGPAGSDRRRGAASRTHPRRGGAARGRARGRGADHPRHRRGRRRSGRLALPVLRRQGGRPAGPGRARHGRDGRAGRSPTSPGLETLSVASLVETTMAAFVEGLPAPPAFVEIYLRGRTNPAVHGFGREHNGAPPQTLRDLAVDAGLARAGPAARRRGARRRGRRPDLPARLRARRRGRRAT